MKVDLAKLNDVLQISAVVFGTLAALAALGAYFTSSRLQETFENKVAQLEKEQAGRVLTNSQASGLVADLRAVPRSNAPIHLIGLQGDREAIKLANSLKNMFLAAGFAVDGVWEDVIIGGAGAGILVRQRTASDPVGVGIVSSLKNAGLDARLVALDTDKVEVIVGHKP